jgi:hypothetical protein
MDILSRGMSLFTFDAVKFTIDMAKHSNQAVSY